jgi:hypothetical protein
MDEMCSVMCSVNKGDLPLEIYWMHTDATGTEKRVITNDGVVITRTNQRISMLLIEAVKARHRGNYTCVAKNKGGEMHHTAVLYLTCD